MTAHIASFRRDLGSPFERAFDAEHGTDTPSRSLQPLRLFQAVATPLSIWTVATHYQQKTMAYC
jgi:hypothetical protein